jgi:hypothetical protein
MRGITMRGLFGATTAAALLFVGASSASAQNLQLTIANGRVTLVADNVPVRQILAEWSRIGNTQMVNAEKLGGSPVTLRLLDVPEAQALDVVLRSASGYMAAPRAAGQAGASRFDRVLILATSRPTTTGPPPALSNAQPRFQPQPPPMIMPQPVEQEEMADDQDVPMEEMAPDAMPGFAPQPGAMPGQVSPNAPGFVPPTPATVQMPVPQGQVNAPITSPRPGLLPQPAQPQQPEMPPPVPPPVTQNPTRPIPN